MNLSRILGPRLTTESRSRCYGFIVAVWLPVAIYAILHDQYIVRIAPEHFTVYHPPIGSIRNPAALAFLHALGASLGPGLCLGVALFFASRCGRWPRLGLRYVLVGTLVVIGVTELAALFAGGVAYYTRGPIYPAICYPVHTLPLIVTSTIQWTCYCVAAMASLVFMGLIIRKRMKLAR
jgi:hypothetical protein